MARERMIIRMVTQTTAKVMCVNVTTAEVTINEYTIGGTYTESDLLKKCKSLFESDEFKLVHIESSKVEEILLGMTEEDFIRYATVYRQGKYRVIDSPFYRIWTLLKISRKY